MRDMNTQTHTPGPWFVHPGTDGRERGHIRELKTESTSGRHVAVARITYAGREYGECEANARLIAAAPELLEACQEALTAATNVFHGDIVKEASRVRAVLRSALAKAKGEA
jgi:hypothetical protein